MILYFTRKFHFKINAWKKVSKSLSKEWVLNQLNSHINEWYGLLECMLVGTSMSQSVYPPNTKKL